MEEKYCYKYPRPAVTADCVVFAPTEDKVFVLLVKRANEPFKDEWALPGGFLEENETLEQCASRELKEETGIADVELTEVGAFSAPGRDPRGRTVSVAYFALVNKDECAPRAADDAKEVAWFDLEALPALAFDHSDIIVKAMVRLVAIDALDFYTKDSEKSNKQ